MEQSEIIKQIENLGFKCIPHTTGKIEFQFVSLKEIHIKKGIEQKYFTYMNGYIRRNSLGYNGEILSHINPVKRTKNKYGIRESSKPTMIETTEERLNYLLKYLKKKLKVN